MSKLFVVPVDGSTNAFRAVELACELARAEQAGIEQEVVLRFVHVVPDRALPDELRRFAEIEHLSAGPERLYEVTIARNVLSAASDQARALGCDALETAVAHGDPADQILAAAADADSIVMGTRGLSDLAGVLFGSVAHQVCHRSGCRTILVK